MRPIVVLHHVQTWLPRTCTWLDTQVRFLPNTTESHIFCGKTDNLDTFPISNLHNASDQPLQRNVDRVARRIGLWNHPRSAVGIAGQIGATVLHSHFGQVGWADVKLAKDAGLKHVTTFYGADVHQAARLDGRWYERYRHLFENVDRVLCEGPFMAESVIDLGCPEHKVMVHPLGVDLERHPFAFLPPSPNELIRVLVAGTFRQKKGIPIAIEALNRVSEQSDVPFQLDLVGDATQKPGDQEEKSAIEKALSRATYPVTRHGFVDHERLRQLMNECHLMLSPSITAYDGDCEGGAPVTLIEAAAVGTPIVSTTHCDIPGVVTHQETGWLAPERDVGALAHHLEEAFRTTDAWEKMALQARAHVEQRFDAVKQGKALEAIYRSL